MNFALISAVYTALEQSDHPMTTKELSEVIYGDASHYQTIQACCTRGCECGSIQSRRDPRIDRLIYRASHLALEKNEFAIISAIYSTLEQSDHPMTSKELTEAIFGHAEHPQMRYIAELCKRSVRKSKYEGGNVANIGTTLDDGTLVNLWGIRRPGEPPIQPDTSAYPAMTRITAEELEDLRVWFDHHRVKVPIWAIIRILDHSNRIMTSKEIATVIGDDTKHGVWIVSQTCTYAARGGSIEIAGRDPKSNVLLWRREMVLL